MCEDVRAGDAPEEHVDGEGDDEIALRLRKSRLSADIIATSSVPVAVGDWVEQEEGVMKSSKKSVALRKKNRDVLTSISASLRGEAQRGKSLPWRMIAMMLSRGK